MTEGMKGMLAMASAAAIWGVSGIYYKALSNVPPLEVLSHRTLWSVVFFGGVLLVQGLGGELRAALGRWRTWAVLGPAAVLISTNWLGFIYAVQSGEALEASLGYYIFPLVAVGLGYLLLGERFSWIQMGAIGLAVLAVGLLTLGLGVAPWLALVLAGTFGAYGLLKKRLPLGPVISVFIEMMLLAPLALIWIYGAQTHLWSDIGGRSGGMFGRDWGTSLMLMLSGPLTGGPLILFAYAARRIPYATLGLVQYLNPTLQFVIAVTLFGEVFTIWDAVAFPLIWTGLALYSWEAWRKERASRSAAVSSGTVA